MAYVYRHIRLDKNEPFYIGIGSDSTYKRANAKYKGDRNKIWYDITAKSEYEVEVLFDDVDWQFACEKEKEFIALYGRKDNKSGILANMTDGGEGVVGFPMVRTSESIEKQKITLKNRYKTDSEFKKMHLFYLKKGAATRKYLPDSEKTRKQKSESHKILYASGITNFVIGKNKIKVICSETSKIWDSIVDCAAEIGIRKEYLTRMLNGNRKNKTSIRYYNGNN